MSSFEGDMAVLTFCRQSAEFLLSRDFKMKPVLMHNEPDFVPYMDRKVYLSIFMSHKRIPIPTSRIKDILIFLQPAYSRISPLFRVFCAPAAFLFYSK